MRQRGLLRRAGIWLGLTGSGWQGAERAEDVAQYDVFIPGQSRFLTSCPRGGGVCVLVWRGPADKAGRAGQVYRASVPHWRTEASCRQGVGASCAGGCVVTVSWMFIYFILQTLAIREMVPSAEE